MRQKTVGNEKLIMLKNLCIALKSIVIQTDLNYDDKLVQELLKEINSSTSELINN